MHFTVYTNAMDSYSMKNRHNMYNILKFQKG